MSPQRLVPLLTAAASIGAAAAAFAIIHRDAEISGADIQPFKTVFIGIILEALPFVLLGVLFSAILQVFVPDELIRRLMPSRPLPAILIAGLAGILFPLCECGMIPVVRRLIRKGMPASAGIAYILAGPVVNPVVFYSTYSAFGNAPAMAFARTGLAFAVAVLTGVIVWKSMRGNPLKADLASMYGSAPTRRDELPASAGSRLISTMAHASDEFFDMGKYLIFGAALAALFQTAVSRSMLEELGGSQLYSHLFLMGLAFLLSLCSTSDAFVAASFGGSFEHGALLAFLVFGPMIDLKSLMMLLASFRARFVLTAAASAALLVLAGSWIVEALFLS